VIDKYGFRLNVGIVLCNAEGKLLWARRVQRHNAWQFPQGGIRAGETAKDAMYRELTEELGLYPHHVQYMSHTQRWLFYRLPKQYIRYDTLPLCIGQKQKWFLLRLITDDKNVNLAYSAKPEFIEWRWVDYWHPLKEVVVFKRLVYQRMLEQFAPLILTK
jgi:putative (di)nucleoside polyphosphate hydrolase